MRLLQEKAIFMIFIILLSTIALYTPNVKAQQQVCCEKTKDNAFCTYTDASNCDTNLKQAPALCDQTSFCSLGCCFDSDSGDCFTNTAEAECDQLGSTWEPSPTCEIQQCTVGCCQLNNQAFISTLTKCKQVTSQYPSVEMNFDSSIQDEYSCINSVRSGELGCCVQSEGECTFTTRQECGAQEIIPQVDEEENIVESSSSSLFKKGVLCSNDQLTCDAAKLHHLDCYNEDVYWFDSQGNQENIFLGNSAEAKQRSYNNGRILTNPGCEATPNDPNCGNCDYTKGTLCGKKDGDFTCLDLNCRDTLGNEFSPDAGGNKDLGESWCVFDGPVGFGQDRVGSRHFRTSCINSEEIIEPCADFREEFCTQSYSQGEATTPFGSFNQLVLQAVPQLSTSSSHLANMFSERSGYSEAACRQNRFDSCSQCNDFSSTEDIIECCNEIAYRDCRFIISGLTEKGGTCVPDVPPGLRFWSDQSSTIDRQTTPTAGPTQGQTTIDRAPSAPGDSVCAEANEECEVGFTRGGISHLLGRSDWECTYNCHCLQEDTFAAAHSICRSIGDCGAYFNYEGVFTDNGYDIKADGPQGELAIPSNLRAKVKARIRDDLLRNALARPPEQEGEPEKPTIGDFFSKSAIPLTAIGLTSLYGFAISGMPGLVGGLLLGPTSLLSVLTAPFAAFGAESGLRAATFGQSFGNTLTQAGFGKNVNPLLVKGGEGVFLPKGTIQGADAVKTGLANYVPKEISSAVASHTDLMPGATFSHYATGGNPVFKAPVGETFKSGLTVQSVPLEGSKALLDPKGGLELTNAIAESGAASVDGGSVVISEAGKVPLAEGQVTFLGTGAGAPTVFGYTLQVVNVISWVWTVYNLIDWLNADTRTGKVSFICKAWEAPDGARDCDKCNEGKLPCSEYRCKSLGKSCSIVNEGTETELCTNIAPNDNASPRIKADKEAMKDYTIKEESSKGFTVQNKIPPFTPVTLALLTDEPAQCKFSDKSSTKFDDMQFDFGSSLFLIKHEMNFQLPSELTTDQALQLTNGGKFTIYTRCKDSNGNVNQRDYFIKFAIKEGPDLTPPKIESTSLNSGAFIASDIDEVPLSIYITEPSQCKWDKKSGKSFDLMEGSFSCTGNGFDIEPINQGLYACSAVLPLIKPSPTQQEVQEEATRPTTTKRNTFYFKCKDHSNNINTDDFPFQLISTLPIEITETSPNELLRTGNEIELKVKTTGGAENGIAICGFSKQEDSLPTQIPAFSNTEAAIHTQIISLEEGQHKYFVTCTDKAGNEAKDTIEFSVEADTADPFLTTIFKDNALGILHIKTNEPTTCKYAETNFEFDRGIAMTNPVSKDHEATLGNVLYVIKCQDEFTNEITFRVFP